jgi:hypothetical protein
MKKNKSIKYKKQRGGMVQQIKSMVPPGMAVPQIKSMVPPGMAVPQIKSMVPPGMIPGMQKMMPSSLMSPQNSILNLPPVKKALKSVNVISEGATKGINIATTNIKKVKKTYETVLFWYATVPMILGFIFGLLQFLIPIGIFFLICEIIILAINGLQLGFYKAVKKIADIKIVKAKIFKSLKPKKPKMIPHIWILLWDCLMGLINKKEKKKKKKK